MLPAASRRLQAALNNHTAVQLLNIEDVNDDGQVNNADLQMLLDDLKTNGEMTDPVPEPGSFVLLAAGSMMLMLLRGRSLLAGTPSDCRNGRCA
jgi:hypothetical protein